MLFKNPALINTNESIIFPVSENTANLMGL